ncbi:hypothetical protein B7494_g758 [Chlorociboria aeruginascens]|nr:hypothetical protein B7494_g758 [Chlorociboria aeruginascens]
MAPNAYPQCILLGDSIVQYASYSRDAFSFGAGLQEHCIRRLDIINRGFSGYTTANALTILESLLPQPSCAKVDYLLVLFGANDACLPGLLQHVPLQQYRENIKMIISHPSVLAHNPAILLVTPPLINEVVLELADLVRGGKEVTRRQRVTAEYADAIRKIAAETKDQKVILIDLWKAMMDEAIALTPDYTPGKELLGSKERGDSDALRTLLTDGLHLTGHAYRIFLREVIAVVGEEWKDEPFEEPSWLLKPGEAVGEYLIERSSLWAGSIRGTTKGQRPQEFATALGFNEPSGMDSQFTATREELYHVQMDVKHVQAIQINHSDRLLRLEKRQADDAALKSVWAFPGVLSGTPQQGPVQNPPTDVFDDFDDEQGQNLLGSLQLEADEEPVRRGASRANSVRFDVSAIQGSGWAGSRSSGEFGPVRPSSGIGSHPMGERSLSHKSDGRHSSAGHSVHSIHSAPSGRTSSLGLDTNFAIGQSDDSPLDIPDPPPGLFILGSVPSIIRCWLDTNFSHNALLYAVVCTGSQRSFLDSSLVKELGLSDQIQKNSTGRHNIKLPVYLPEAVITQSSSRSNSPAPQLPALTANFEITGLNQRSNTDHKKSIRVFLGSDTLRSHNADVLFSQNLMTLYGDDRNKLSVPFVRPEDESLFKNLCIANITPEKNELKATAAPFTPIEPRSKVEPTMDMVTSVLVSERHGQSGNMKSLDSDLHSISGTEPQSPSEPTSSAELNSPNQYSVVIAGTAEENIIMPNPSKKLDAEKAEGDISDAPSSVDTSRRESSSGIWGSWRQGSTAIIGGESESGNGYQRATAARGGRSMKVLKSSKSISSAAAPGRSSSAAKTGAAYEPAPQRLSGESRRKSQAGSTENMPPRWESRRVGSDKQKGPLNPIGGASAFAWMNPSKPKASATAE